MLPPTGALGPGDGKSCLLVAGFLNLSAAITFSLSGASDSYGGGDLPGIIDPDLTGKTHLILYTYT